MDKFADMVLFASIVKNQGLAAAGRELSLSPAPVPARLLALDDRYGVKLLNRRPRHLPLTDTAVLSYP
ncbi:LysR family transcriptional regulator, partial [Vibrio cholerae]|uniref:LysR family transcriptional regulator n=1 Tax=Vibrio cholerae TaxID=666 RepID=UPI001157AF86